MQAIEIKLFNSPAEAPNYNTNGEGVKTGFIKEAVIVKNGTQGGNATIDLIFVDANGQKYVAMITANLLKQVVDIAR